MNRNLLVETFKVAAAVAAGSFVYLYLTTKGAKKAVEE